MAAKAWKPPVQVKREEIVKISGEVLGMPDIPIKVYEDIHTIERVGMEWDIGLVVYEPEDPDRITRDAFGKKVGIFFTHGGSGDFKNMERQSRIMAEKFGFKVVSYTFPGRFYFDDESRDWPDETIRDDGTVRTPIWKQGEYITPDQYDVIQDRENWNRRMRYGTRTLARAKPDTLFYYRMAGWPMAMEGGGVESMKRHFPEDDWSIYVHGHSTGGPQVCMLSQRVPNVRGILAIENSSFGYINEAKHDWSGHLGKIKGFERITKKPASRTDPFNELYIRTWRDRARYWGPEALGQEGPNALMRLPWLMEEIFEDWEKLKKRPQFKCEYLITHNVYHSLTDAARITGQRLQLSPGETGDLVCQYLGLTRELHGPESKPVPPVMFGISKDSRDHSEEVYEEVILPMFRAMNPAPKTHVTHYWAGVHGYMKPEEGLPMGVGPCAFKVYRDAIVNGFFKTDD